jgi:hypothetical protein
VEDVQYSAKLESLNPEDLAVWRTTELVMRVPTWFLPGLTEAIAVLDSEKPEALADIVEAQIHPGTVPSVLAVIAVRNLLLRSYILTISIEPYLTNPDEVHVAIGGLKVVNPADPNGIPNRARNQLY